MAAAASRPLINILCQFNNNCTPEMLGNEIRRQQYKNNQFIRTLQMTTIHLLPAERNFSIQGAFITWQPARPEVCRDGAR